MKFQFRKLYIYAYTGIAASFSVCIDDVLAAMQLQMYRKMHIMFSFFFGLQSRLFRPPLQHIFGSIVLQNKQTKKRVYIFVHSLPIDRYIYL